MFQFLKIEKFQSHENTLLHFDKGVNVIFGLSQAGKTAITRAMRLLIDNRPLGGRFFSDFAGDKGDTKITLGIDNQEIAIIKSIRVNKEGEKQVTKTAYTIGDMEFSSPKDQVPDQIVAALNISELNIQKQFDPPFLVSSSGGEIAKTINRITRLEEVDGWVSELTSEINSNNRDITRMEAEAKGLIQEIAVYKDIEETEQIINELQSKTGEIAGLLIRQNDLDKLLVSFENAIRTLEKFDGVADACKHIEEAEELQIEIIGYEVLEQMLANYESKAFDDENLVRAERYVTKSEKIDSEIVLFFEMRSRLRVYEQAVDDVEQKVLGLENAKMQYVDLLRKIKKCPTCFADINAKHLKAIEDNL